MSTGRLTGWFQAQQNEQLRAVAVSAANASVRTRIRCPLQTTLAGGECLYEDVRAFTWSSVPREMFLKDEPTRHVASDPANGRAAVDLAGAFPLRVPEEQYIAGNPAYQAAAFD